MIDVHSLINGTEVIAQIKDFENGLATFSTQIQ
jgi:hypothetical protein